MRLKQPRALSQRRPTTLLAMFLGAVGVIALVLSIWLGSAGGWIPNVATSAWTMALTVAVVDRLVQRERLQSRSDYASDRLHEFIQSVAEQIATDYTQTHLSGAAEPTALRLADIPDQWLRGRETRDAPDHLVDASVTVEDLGSTEQLPEERWLFRAFRGRVRAGRKLRALQGDILPGRWSPPSMSSRTAHPCI